MVLEKLSVKNSNFTKNAWLINFFCHPAILQFSMADNSFSIACKEMKIAQIAQVKQLFKLLNSVRIYSHGFYELSRLLMRKNVNYGSSKDSPI